MAIEHGQVDNIFTLQNSENIRNPQLRIMLEFIDENLPDQELFYTREIQMHLGRLFNKRDPTIIEMLYYLRELNILSPAKQENDNRQNKYLYSRDQVLLVGPFIKAKETEQSLRSIAKRVHWDLGTHPLSLLIKNVEENEGARTLSQIDTETGNLWKTPLGGRIKGIITNPAVSNEPELFSSSEIAKGLELTDDYKHLVTLLYSNNKGVLKGVEKKVVGKKGFKLAFKAEHYVLAGMYFGLLQQGATPGDAKAQLAQLVDGTSLAPYFSKDGSVIHASRNRQLFKTNSLWINLPFYGNEEPISVQQLPQAFEHPAEKPMTKTEQILMRLGQIDESDLETAKNWTAQELQQKMGHLSRLDTRVKRELFPEEMIRIIEIIYQIEKGSLKDLELEVKMANDFNFQQKVKTTLAFLQKYPKLENCANLILALRRKFKSELEKEKDS